MAIPYNQNYKDTTPFSDVCAQIALAANTEKTFTIPGVPTQNYTMAINLNSTSNVFVCLNATPIIPSSGTVGTQQYNEYRPEGRRYVKGGDVVHMITPDATAYVGLSLMSVN